MICFSSAGIGGIGRRRTSMPSAALPGDDVERCRTRPALSGKSSRKCPPRLSFRSIADRVMASDTVSRWCRSSAVCQPGLYSRCPVTAALAARAFRLANVAERLLHLRLRAHDPDQVLHHVLQRGLDSVGILPAALRILERLHRLVHGRFDRRRSSGAACFSARTARRIRRPVCRRRGGRRASFRRADSRR